MPQRDARPGLLSMMARWVRQTVTGGPPPESPPTEDDDGYSRQALQALVERRRKNDWVRRREFDQLRQLRQGMPTSHEDATAPASLPDSELSLDAPERTETLKKIDDIEAQMSHQWWKSQPSAQPTAPAPAPLGVPGAQPAPTSTPAAPSASSKPQVAPPADPAPAGDASSLMPASLLAQQALPTQVSPLLATQIPAQASTDYSTLTVPAVLAGPDDSSARAAGHSDLLPDSLAAPARAGAPERRHVPPPPDSPPDPELQEAAIRFANGDLRGAQEVLQQALQTQAGTPAQQWLWAAALLDLYRVTGQQASFEACAADMAARLGRPRPRWSGAAAVQTPPLWASPRTLTHQALAELLELLARQPASSMLDWRALAEISADALPGLGQVLADWADTPVELEFLGWERLDRALRAATPAGNPAVAPARWQARLDALRLMGLQDEFELVALEYCVTYAVAPPSWRNPRGRCRVQSSLAALQPSSPSPRLPDQPKPPHISADPPPGSQPDPQPAPQSAYQSAGQSASQSAQQPAPRSAPQPTPQPITLELAGELLGEVPALLRQLDAGSAQARHLVLSCARLVRVDFTAAGGLLNWVQQKQSQGCQVELHQVNRLVAAFFSLIGITEHARVLTAPD